MRGCGFLLTLGFATIAATLIGACAGGDADSGGVAKSTASVRAARRSFDGAPPVIPHAPGAAACTACHDDDGTSLPEGFAPPMPHERTAGMSAISRCTQCHVYQVTQDEFRESEFVGLRQDLRRGDRMAFGAPPMIPHRVQMRENCAACHTGPAAREEIRCSHPERARCVQCHVEPESDAGTFAR